MDATTYTVLGYPAAPDSASTYTAALVFDGSVNTPGSISLPATPGIAWNGGIDGNAAVVLVGLNATYVLFTAKLDAGSYGPIPLTHLGLGFVGSDASIPSAVAFPIFPPIGAVAAGVPFGPSGTLTGVLTYAGFLFTGDAPSPPVDRRRNIPALILDKPLADVRLYDVDLTYLLGDGEVILFVKSIRSDVGNVGFGSALINPAPIYYRLLDQWADIGKVVQVQLQGGAIPYGACELRCPVKMLVATNQNPAIEAEFTIRLIP